jgi:hypothetical protein
MSEHGCTGRRLVSTGVLTSTSARVPSIRGPQGRDVCMGGFTHVRG